VKQGSNNPPPPSWTDKQTLDSVRPAVRDMLMAVPSFRKLSPEEQRNLAQSMVKVTSYLANPEGVATVTTSSGTAAGNGKTARAPSPLAPGQRPLASAQAKDAVEQTKERLAKAPGQVGKEFEAGAVKQGVQQFGELVQKVDFPKFVGGLIQNVFQAIVDSSIQQMRAYGELIANVAKTVDQFAQDNISENNARDWLAEKYPDVLGVDISATSGGLEETSGATQPPPQQAQLTAKGDNPEQRLTKVSAEVGLDKPVTDVSDPDEEARLVLGARLQMARARQQLLASMVMLGINRIVVTDGHIQAKVIFDMRAEDVASRKASASMLDQRSESEATRFGASIGGWMSPVDASYESTTEKKHMATVQSAVDDSSESKAQVKAQLSGEVKVNFKSDYFPMEKMASPEMIAAIQGNAKPPEKSVTHA
jgi:hypothetical protein